MKTPHPGTSTDGARPSEAGGSSEATILLQRVRAGDEAAAHDLLPLVYKQLRATAGVFFQSQDSGHTLQPTALVHEAYLKLIGGTNEDWEGRSHFCAVAGKAMRQILQDHAKAKRSVKRGGGNRPKPVTNIASPSGSSTLDVLVLDEVLDRLAAVDARGAEIVEMRFFGGLTHEEAARVLGLSVPTVERSWRRSRAWIADELADAGV